MSKESEGSNGSEFILAAVSDLFFLVQIQDAAKRAGFQLRQARDREALFEIATLKPALIVVDLHAVQFDLPASIRALKSDETLRSVPVLAYLSHVQADLARQAREAGADYVSAKSALMRTIQQVLARVH